MLKNPDAEPADEQEKAVLQVLSALPDAAESALLRVSDAQTLEKNGRRAVRFKRLNEETHSAAANHVRLCRVAVGEIKIHEFHGIAFENTLSGLNGLRFHGASADGSRHNAVGANQHGGSGVPRR